MVVAAGNDGARSVHASGRIVAGEVARVWASGSRGRPARTHGLGSRSRSATDGPEPSIRLSDPDGSSVGTFGAREPRRYRVQLTGDEVRAGTYTLAIDGPAEFDVFLSAARLGPTFFAPALAGPFAHDREQVSIPATTAELIAVGATVSARAAERRPTLDGAVGDVASFSARGPTASGLAKPDVVAPGGWIRTTLSSQVLAADSPNVLAGGVRPSGRRIAVRGTSAAAAVVAGMLLLVMEERALDAVSARALLIAAADGGTWDPRAGWGTVRFEPLRSAASGRSESPFAIVATRPLVVGEDALWLSARGAVGPISLRGVGTLRETTHGQADIHWPVSASSVGEPIVIEAQSGGATQTIVVPVVFDRSPYGAIRIGGGCAIARSSTNLPPQLSLVAILVLGLRPSRRRRRRR